MILKTPEIAPTDEEGRFQKFAARFNADMAEAFRDWPKGCIVRGPFITLDPIEQIEIVAECVGMDPEASR